MDWTDTGYSYSIGVNVVHQTNVDNTLGSLSGVQLSGMSITENYYSDSRVQAKVTTIVKDGDSDGYVKNARLRIILSVPERDLIEELMTGYVSDMVEASEHGYTKRTYTLEGTIWGLLDHKIADPITIGKGAKMITIWSSLMKTLTKMQYSTEGAQDTAFSNVILYEPGTALSTILFELSSGYDRMDVDGHGVVTLRKYTPPSKKTPSRIIDYNDLRGLSMTPLERTTSEYELPGRAIVTTTVSTESNGKTSQQVIAGYYDAPATDPTSIDTRGWLIARTDSYSGSSENPSKSELNAIAKKNWESAQNKGIQWSGSSVFANYHAGEVVTLIAPAGKEPDAPITGHKVLIQSVSTNLEQFTQDLTLKEV